MIKPAFAGLGDPGERAESLDPFFRRGCLRGMWRAVAADLVFANQLLDWIGIWGRHYTAESHAKRQQITNRDRALRRDRVIEPAGEGSQEPAIAELRQAGLDRFGEAEPAV